MGTEPNVTYVPPATDVFMKLATAACSALAEKGESAANDPEVVCGLAEYLGYVAELTAKYLNKGHYELLDSENS